MRFDDLAADRQAEPHALRLGRDEGLEQPRRHLRLDAGAGIGDPRERHAVLAAPCRQNKLPTFAGLHRLYRVAHQVQYHLLDLYTVDEDGWKRVVELELYPNAVVLGTH